MAEGRSQVVNQEETPPVCWIQEAKQSYKEESKEGTSRPRKKNHERVQE